MGKNEEDEEVFEPSERPEEFEGKVEQDKGEDYEDA